MTPHIFQCGTRHRAAFTDPVEGPLPKRVGWFHDVRLALPGLSRTATRDVISAAFQVAQVYVRLPFYRTRTAKAAKIVLQIGNPEEFDGPSGTLAWADVVSLRDPSQSLIEFDPGESWNVFFRNYSEINALNVILHEGGHAIGFGHSTVKRGLMNPYYDPEVCAPSAAELRLLRKQYPELKPQ